MSFEKMVRETGLVKAAIGKEVLKDQNSYTFDLGTARDYAEVEHFMVADVLVVSSITGSASIKFNSLTETAYDLTFFRKFVKSPAFPIDRIYLYNVAQAGKTLMFVTGGDSSFFPEITPASEGELQKKVNKATTPVIYNVTCTAANMEYSQALPASTKKFMISFRDVAHAGRLAFVTGKVATPVEPYETLWAGSPYEDTMIEATSLTLFFASLTAGAVAEIVAWS